MLTIWVKNLWTNKCTVKWKAVLWPATVHWHYWYRKPNIMFYCTPVFTVHSVSSFHTCCKIFQRNQYNFIWKPGFCTPRVSHHPASILKELADSASKLNHKVLGFCTLSISRYPASTLAFQIQPVSWTLKCKEVRKRCDSALFMHFSCQKINTKAIHTNRRINSTN